MICDCENRLKVCRGEDLPHAKLTEDDIREIRAMHHYKMEQIEILNKKYSAKAIAQKYGVHYRTIEKILSYETWRHVL